MKKTILLFLVLAAIFCAIFWAASRYGQPLQEFKYELKEVSVGSHVFSVQIADSEEKRSQGLGGRRALGESEGMLFVFPKPSYPVFWMKDMLIPIDIIWIDGERVIGFAENVRPEKPGEEFALYRPPYAVRYVLEVKAGTVRARDIKKGDGFSIQ